MSDESTDGKQGYEVLTGPISQHLAASENKQERRPWLYFTRQWQEMRRYKQEQEGVGRRMAAVWCVSFLVTLSVCSRTAHIGRESEHTHETEEASYFLFLWRDDGLCGVWIDWWDLEGLWTWHTCTQNAHTPGRVFCSLGCWPLI